MTAKPIKQIFTILGCGSSQGVPRPDGHWGACDPKNPKNRRRRASFLIEQISDDGGKTTIVIDTGPDFREQMISARVKHIDAVIYTHEHADHTHGIADLRGFALAMKKRVDIYANERTLDYLTDAFSFCLKTPPGSDYPPIVSGNLIDEDCDAVTIEGAGGPVTLMLIKQIHGPIETLGFRIGNLAYCSDVSDFPKESVEKLQDLDHLIIDATLPKPHFSHFSLEQALEWIEKLSPKQAYITHMHIPLDYDAVMRDTPDHVQPSHDGLSFEVIL